jgi:nickel and cobalt resistance protein CnrR
MTNRPEGDTPPPQSSDPTGRWSGARGRPRGIPWRGSIITIVLAGLAAFLGAHLGTRQTHRPPAPLSERVYEALNETVHLTDQQKQSIRAIGERYTPIRERLRMQSRGLNVRLARLMAEEQGLGPQTSASLEQLQNVMGERLKLSMQYMLEVREVLNAEQRAYFDRKVAEEASLSR